MPTKGQRGSVVQMFPTIALRCQYRPSRSFRSLRPEPTSRRGRGRRQGILARRTARTTQRVKTLVFGLDQDGQCDSIRAVTVVTAKLDIEDGLVCLRQRLVLVALAVFVALFVDSELDDIQDIGNKV